MADTTMELKAATDSIIFKAASSQSANIHEYTDTSDALLSYIDSAGKFHLSIGETAKKTNVSDANYAPSAATTDYIVAFTALSAARTAVISTEDRDSGSTTAPRIIVIKDQSGSCSPTNTITVSLETAGNIDGAATIVLNGAYESITVYLDGTNGFII